MRPLFLVVSLIAFSIMGCNDPADTDQSERQNNTSDLPWRGVSTYELQDLAEEEIDFRVIFDADTLAQPSWLNVTETRIILADISSPPLHVIDREEREYLYSLGRSGEGPGEFQSVTAVIEDLPAVWMLEGTRHRLTEIELPALQVGEEYGNEEIPSDEWLVAHHQIRGGNNLFSLTKVTDDQFVATGQFMEGRLKTIHSDGSEGSTLGDEPIADDIPVHVMQHAYQGYVTYSEENELIAVGNRHADLLELYDLDGNQIELVHGPDQFTPEFSIREGRDEPAMASGSDLRFGFVDIASTDEYIYALYSGRTRAEAPGSANFGTSIIQYDWQGTPLRQYVFDKELLSMDIAPDGTIYGTIHDPQPAIVAYEVN